MSRFRSTHFEQNGLGVIFSCLQALRHGEDSVDADTGMMLLAEYLHNVRGIASFFQKR